MIRKLLLLLALIYSLTVVNGQSLEFVYKGEILENNEKITITEFTSDPDLGDEMLFEATIRNKTNADVRLRVSKEELEVSQGSQNNFCTLFGCYTGLSSPEYTIKANGEDKLFHGAFYPVTKATAKIKYKAKVASLDQDEVSVEVTYSYVPSGLKKTDFRKFTLIQVQNNIELIYAVSEETNLSVIDMTGKTVEKYKLIPDASSISLNKTLKKGIYFLIFTSSSGTYTEKIIVR